MLRRFPSEFEVLGGSARSRGRGWWHWLDGGGSGCDERDRNGSAAELTREGEDGLSPSIAGYGGIRGMACGCLGVWRSSGVPFYRRPESVPTSAVDKNGEPPFSSLQNVVAATGTSGRARG